MTPTDMQLSAVVRRLRSEPGAEPLDLARRLDLPGGVVGIHSLLARLSGQGLAHQRDGLWFSGPDPEPPAPRRLVLTVRAPPSRPPWLAELASRTTTSTPYPPETPMDSAPTSLRAGVIADVAAHPGTKAGDVARRLGADREQVSRLLARLRTEGLLRLEGNRALARWWRSAQPLPSSPPAAQSAGAPPLVGWGTQPVVDDLALVDQVLDLVGAPPGPRPFRLGVLLGQLRAVAP